jgi:hypothetical protein
MEMELEWFQQNFFDIRKHKPQKGQCLAQFRAVADFVDGWVKQNVVELLVSNEVGAEGATKVLRNMCCATEIDSIRVPLAICRDLMKGMSEEQVLAKDYKMVVEQYYWTKAGNVPADNPHWAIINLINKDSELDKIMKCEYSVGSEVDFLNLENGVCDGIGNQKDSACGECK